jgi:hypothetical protein
MKTYGRVDVQTQVFLTSALVGSFTYRALYPPPPGERAPGIHQIGAWVGSKTDVDAVEKRILLTLPVARTPTPQPVAGRYTKLAIPLESGSLDVSQRSGPCYRDIGGNVQ